MPSFLDEKPEKCGPVRHFEVDIDLKRLTEDQLFKLQEDVRALLPTSSLSEMNLEEELVEQYLAAKRLQASLLDDRETPANQRAQVANSVMNTLAALAKMQSEQYSVTRLIQIENILLDLMNERGDDFSREFLAQYEAKILNNQ